MLVLSNITYLKYINPFFYTYLTDGEILSFEQDFDDYQYCRGSNLSDICLSDTLSVLKTKTKKKVFKFVSSERKFLPSYSPLVIDQISFIVDWSRTISTYFHILYSKCLTLFLNLVQNSLCL